MAEKVKRFVVMGGSVYYASGGFEDYRGSYDSREDAERAMKDFLDDAGQYSWAHIGDLETGEFFGHGEACNPMKLLA